MKMSQTLIFVAVALVLAFAVPVKSQDEQQDYLREHNRARAAVGVASIKWHPQVARYAMEYAKERKEDCRLIHSKGGPYGENLAWHSGSMSGSDAVKMWVNEKKDYDHDTNTCKSGKQCGHYTQVVWRKSEWLGCAKVKCDNGRGTFVICSYSPRGNIRGQKPY